MLKKTLSINTVKRTMEHHDLHLILRDISHIHVYNNSKKTLSALLADCIKGIGSENNTDIVEIH